MKKSRAAGRAVHSYAVKALHAAGKLTSKLAGEVAKIASNPVVRDAAAAAAMAVPGVSEGVAAYRTASKLAPQALRVASKAGSGLGTVARKVSSTISSAGRRLASGARSVGGAAV